MSFVTDVIFHRYHFSPRLYLTGVVSYRTHFSPMSFLTEVVSHQGCASPKSFLTVAVSHRGHFPSRSLPPRSFLTEVVHGEIVVRVGVQRVGVSRRDLSAIDATPDEDTAVGAAHRHQVLPVIRPAHVSHVAAVPAVLPKPAVLFLRGTGSDCMYVFL